MWLRPDVIYALTMLLCPLGVSGVSQAASSVSILYSDRFLLHDAGPRHPDTPDRLRGIVQQLKQHKTLGPRLQWPAFRTATREDLLRAHQASYLDLLAAEQKQLTKTTPYLTLSTGDTVISKHSLTVAKLATGAAMAGVDAVMSNRTKSAFALVRPPGHHATADKGMGFCIYNHVAVAARYAQKKYGVQKILMCITAMVHKRSLIRTAACFISAHTSIPYTQGPGGRKRLGRVLVKATP